MAESRPTSRYDRENAKADFIAWFEANYKPGCILSNPTWHAPKIFRIAEQVFERLAQINAAASENSAHEGYNGIAHDVDRDAIIEECAQVGWNASMNGAPVAYAIRMLKGKK